LDAFDVRQSNKIEKASTLDLLGCIHVALADIEAAGNNFYEALQLRLKYLGQTNPHHPDIGVSYHNLGKINSKTRNFTGAETNYSRAAEIYRQNYPQTHPLVRGINDCLKETQRQLKC
jgi:tetratricopeptide (TPR) repeat protein